MGRFQPSNRTIAGIAMLIFGAIVFGVGLHHMVATGTCSSTGYSANYGPVPHCPKGTGYWFAFLFGGIFMVIIGALISGVASVVLIIPVLFTAIGIGSLTVAFDHHVASGSKTFGLIFGGAFAAVGLIPVLVAGAFALRRVVRGRRTAPPRAGLRTPPALSISDAAAAFGSSRGDAAAAFGGAAADASGDPILGAYAASSAGGPAAATRSAVAGNSTAGGASSGADPLDKLAKLAELRKSGALTDDEFNREKAKLLAEL